MTWMWIVWYAVVIGLFAVFERYALKHPDRQWTLSKTMAYIGRQWPLSIFLLGGLFIGLGVHFYWNWCPTF